MRNWLRTVLLPALSLGLSAGAAVSGAFIQEPDGGLREWAMIGAASCIAAAGALAIVEKKLAARQRDVIISKQADFRVAVNDLLQPLIVELGRALAATGQERARLLAGLVPLALVMAALLLGEERTRASYFRMGRDENGVMIFRPAHSSGRAGQPRTTFRNDRDPGRRLLQDLLGEPGYDFCPDVTVDPPDGYAGGDRGYRTYLSVLARNGDKIAGIVTVDSPASGDLSANDRHFLSVVATIIAIAENEAGTLGP